MDGNGRWANNQGKVKIDGYKKGSEVAYDIAKYCTDLTIPYLTLYAFSMENWLRPKNETDCLFDLFYSVLTNEDKVNFICNCNIKLNFIGNLSLLPSKILDQIKKAEEMTHKNDGLLLTVAVSYGAKQEITQAISNIIKENIAYVSEEEFEKFLYTKDLPKLDLLIRTGGEKRLSNFLLWQAAYAELYFCDTLWPDFSCQDLSKALEDYTKREKKYAVLSSFEWYNLTQGNKILYVFALLLIALPSASLIYLYNLPQGKYALVWFVLTIWGIDVTAYLFGKNFGGAKICPILSPGKTWTGLLGAILAGVVCTIFGSIFFGLFSILYSPIIGLAIAILAQLGDFTESLVKRAYGVKDSGSMIPGHGGVLDRMDSFIFTAPLIAIYIS
ncbi:isoprenyl transferase [Trichonephila clavata]|uniref:Multifunctional fusion protein n=1 Tax=Trichonephila clavata TaxID=2740835 RepID=A0A8X6J066_TRICU|nr:isoprenyl transferase [Trichonephila clavata]